MRAIRIDGRERVELVHAHAPKPAPGEVLVRVRAAALCATDRRMVALGTHAPRIPGHEAVGVLEDGTPVGVHPNLGCGRCRSCAMGRENRCPDHVDLGIHRDGGLAELVAVPEGHVIPLGSFPLRLAPLLEPLACVLHAATLLDVRPGEPAVVVGAGSLGIVGMWALQALGARVAVAQRSEARRALAERLGADAVVSPEGDPAEALGEPPRAALVAAPGADALAWALERVDVGGRVHAFAGMPGGAPVDANAVHYRHLALVGSTGSTVEDYRRGLEMARSGDVPLDRLPTVEVPLEAVPAVLLDPTPDPGRLKVVVTGIT